jgi:hypothetical protein
MRETLITTREIDPTSQQLLGQEVGQLEIYDGLTTPVSGDVIVLSDEHREQIEKFALASALNYGPDNEEGVRSPELTYVQTEHGLPALVVRIDCTIDSETGDIIPYEMEDSPSGIGISHTVHEAMGGRGFKTKVTEHYERYLGQVPAVVVTGARNHGTDDKLIVGRENYFYEFGNTSIPPELLSSTDRLAIVKAIPGDRVSSSPYLSLQNRLLAPLQTEGDKTYGGRTGMLKKVTSAEDILTDPETDEPLSQVLKRTVGSMAMGISIYLSPEARAVHGKKGTVTLSRLQNTLNTYLETDQSAYIQSFRAPVRIENPEGRSNMIMRVFALLSPGVYAHIAPSANVIGGCWVAREELLVHGASNAVSGAVIVEDGK